MEGEEEVKHNIHQEEEINDHFLIDEVNKLNIADYIILKGQRIGRDATRI